MTTPSSRYDIVVVGAGSAGCVLAARLSLDSARSVLLLEAGPDFRGESSLPPEIRSSLMPAFTHDWDYHSEPGGIGRSIHLARAKLVGGCSATNATLALRGSPADYDAWSTLGNTGWSFDDVLPFFRRLERDADFTDEWHGQDGPLAIRRYQASELTPVQAAFLDACRATGYAPVDDHNRPGAVGAGVAPMNTIAGVRQSTALAYLTAARHRANLTVRSDATVDRVVFENKRAVGARLVDGETISAAHVILAAGAYGSPAILMRSGLGPAAHLRGLGVDVVEDLPGVGQNLMDHPLLGLLLRATLPPPSEQLPFIQTVLTAGSALAGDAIDLHVLPTSILPDESPSGGGMFIIFVSFMRPWSRGELRLRSADPAAAPIVDLGYFSHPNDMPRLIEALRIARQLSRTPPLSDLVLDEEFPGSKVGDSDQDLERAALAQVETYHHAAGTCRMGPASEEGPVVDTRGRVHGIEGLSVVDASIMPVIPSANTNLPTIMLAERCAAWLCSEH